MDSPLLIWPGTLEDHDELLQCMKQPDFADPNFGVWLGRIEGDPSLINAGCGAILAYTTDGLPEDQVVWVSPAQLLDCVSILINLIHRNDASIAEALEEYEDCYKRGKPPMEALLEDLEVVRQRALWAQSIGKTKLTFNLQA